MFGNPYGLDRERRGKSFQSAHNYFPLHDIDWRKELRLSKQNLPMSIFAKLILFIIVPEVLPITFRLQNIFAIAILLKWFLCSLCHSLYLVNLKSIMYRNKASFLEILFVLWKYWMLRQCFLPQKLGDNFSPVDWKEEFIAISVFLFHIGFV